MKLLLTVISFILLITHLLAKALYLLISPRYRLILNSSKTAWEFSILSNFM